MMYEYLVKEVVKVVDGDTLDVTIDLGFCLTTKQRIRLNGIDTPESVTKDESEKKLGLEAKDFVSKWVADNPVIMVSTTKDDKYGRILGEIYGGNSKESLNEAMVRLGYAWRYDGGTKRKNLTELLERRKASSGSLS